MGSPALASWPALQDALKKTTEENAWALLKEEQGSKRRVQYLLRIYGRANKLRTERERRALMVG